LEKQLEFVELQEEYLKDEMRYLKRELLRAKEEIRRIQSVPLVIGQFNEMIDADYGIVSSTAGSNYYVRILSTLDRELLKPNTSIALHRHSHSVVDILPRTSSFCCCFVLCFSLSLNRLTHTAVVFLSTRIIINY